MSRPWGLLLLGIAACGGDADKQSAASSDASGRASSKASAKAPASAKPTASAATTPATTATASAAPSASASAAPDAPAGLATLFDGEPDAAVKLTSTSTFGKATFGLPDGWKPGASWDSVDTLRNTDGSATVVVLRLDISEALLDANISTWVKVPFSTTEVKWEAREAGKLGRAHLDGKVAKGSGKIGKDDADFWHVATASDGKKFGLVVIGGVKKSADPKTRGELFAVMRSAQWK